MVIGPAFGIQVAIVLDCSSISTNIIAVIYYISILRHIKIFKINMAFPAVLCSLFNTSESSVIGIVEILHAITLLHPQCALQSSLHSPIHSIFLMYQEHLHKLVLSTQNVRVYLFCFWCLIFCDDLYLIRFLSIMLMY